MISPYLLMYTALKLFLWKALFILFLLFLLALLLRILAEFLRLQKEAWDRDEEQRREKAKQLKQEQLRKISVIRERGGLLAKELERLTEIPRTTLEVLYLASKQEDIHFDLAVEQKEEVVPYPTARMELVQVMDVSELTSLSPDQLALDDDSFYMRLATQELMRPQYSEVYVTTRKRLYVLLDVSPSMFGSSALMSDGNVRDTWARGLVASLLQDAADGNAEYFFRQFADETFCQYSARNQEEAEVLLSRIANKPEQANGTNIGKALLTAVKDIRSQPLDATYVSHVLLITDGDDQSGLTRKDIVKALGKKIKLHVVLVGTKWTEKHPLAPYVIANY
ncbi:MAG: VWA domain-containing protein [Candidatus Uhrbacteria bacterium]|nr:VWA domain-containing protein [Candidatus Uhrbacteria bacterium]